MSQRKKQTPLTPFLLTYQDFTPSYRDVITSPPIHKNPDTQYAPYNDPVWQTAIRIFQHGIRPAEGPECPEVLDWQAVVCVDVLSHKANSCPICLDNIYKCPRITRCGHVFCFPCISRYCGFRKTDGKQAAPTCPMCFEEFNLQDLRAVRIQRSISTMTTGIFVLTLRYKNTNIVRLADGRSQNYFQRLHYIEKEDADDPTLLFLTPRMFLKHQFFHIYLSILANGEERALDQCLQILDSEARRCYGYQIEEDLPQLHEKIGTICWESDSWLDDLVSSFSVDVPIEAWERYVHSSSCVLTAPADRELPAAAAAAAEAPEGQGFILEAIRKLPYYLSYQLWDGQLHFLTSTALRLLLHEADLKMDAMMKVTPSLRLTWSSEICINSHTKSRYSFLSHLAIGSGVGLHEVELRPYLSEQTKSVFRDYLRGQRQKIAAQHECRSRKDELYHEYVKRKSFYGDTG